MQSVSKSGESDSFYNLGIPHVARKTVGAEYTLLKMKQSVFFLRFFSRGAEIKNCLRKLSGAKKWA